MMIGAPRDDACLEYADRVNFTMKTKLITAISVAIIVALGLPLEASANSKPCSKVGSISGTQAKPLVCKMVKGKRVWVAQVAVVAKRVPGPLYKTTTGIYLGPSIGISVMWGFPYDAGSSSVTGYRLEYMALDTPWTFVVDLPPNVYNQNITDGRPNNNRFRFRVAALNAVGIGPWSESDWVLYGFSSSGSSGSSGTSTGVTTTTVYVPPTSYVPPTTTTTVSPYTNSQIQATRSATSYLKYSAFSRSGLIKQLEYEGFSNADATHGVDRQNADWNAQSAKMATSYLKYSSFSRSGLIKQLLYEGFTQSEAEYGVNAVGL